MSKAFAFLHYESDSPTNVNQGFLFGGLAKSRITLKGLDKMAKISVFLLALGAFVTGTAELIVGGIVKPIADDLHVSLGMAGQLVSAFSVSFAIGAPIVISLTSRMGRKKLLSYALSLFILGCFVSFASTTYAMLMGSRVIVGLSAGVFTVVAFGAAAKLVPAEKIGKAVGTVALGLAPQWQWSPGRNGHYESVELAGRIRLAGDPIANRIAAADSFPAGDRRR